MEERKTVNTENARDGEQVNELKKIEKEGFCPFCQRNYLEKEHPHPIFLETKYWLATKNRWPYENARVHLLLIYKDHITSLEEMSAEAWQELHGLIVQLKKEKDIPGGAFLMRFGDSRYTGATVSHLHAQIISGNPDSGKKVFARVG